MSDTQIDRIFFGGFDCQLLTKVINGFYMAMRNKYVIDGRRNETTCHGIFLQIQRSHVTLVFGRFLNLKSIHSFFDCLENLRDLESTGIGRDCLSVRSAGSSYTGKVPDSHGRSLGAPEVYSSAG